MSWSHSMREAMTGDVSPVSLEFVLEDMANSSKLPNPMNCAPRESSANDAPAEEIAAATNPQTNMALPARAEFFVLDFQLPLVPGRIA